MALVRWLALILVLAWLSIAVGQVSAAPADPLDTWLQELRLPAPVVRALQARRTVDPSARQWLVQEGQAAYVLVEQTVAPDTDARIRQASRGVAEMRARYGLLLYAAGEDYERQGFTNREAIAKALARLDGSTEGRLLEGVQSRSATFETGVAALVWTQTDRIIAYRQGPPPLDRFLPAYCEALYPTARALFQEDRHRQALALYQEMHARQCRQPVAYFLDAADCFIALAQPTDAQRMISYVLNDQTSSLSSRDAERAGDLLFQTGDETGAGRAYQRALDLMLTGR